MLSKLHDMSENGLLKRRYMQITIKMLKVKYGPKTTSMLRNNKHTAIEISTIRTWFYHSLSKQLIHFILNNGMMCCSCLHIELLEITEQGRAWTKLKIVTLNNIKHKPFESNASPLIQKMGKHTNLQNWGWGWLRGCRLWHIRSADPHAPSS